MLSNAQILKVLGFNSKDFYTDCEDECWIYSKKESYCYSDYNKDIYGPDIRVNYKHYYDEDNNEHAYFIELYDGNIVKDKTIRVLSNLDRKDDFRNSIFFKDNILVYNNEVI